MVFSSVEFILIFLPIFLIVYYVVPASFKNAVLFMGSLIFYAYGEPKFVLLLIGSVFINYFLVKGMVSGKAYVDANELVNESVAQVGSQSAKIQDESLKEKRTVLSKVCLALGIVLNVSLLSFFKVAPAEIGLPLGISFYTFQSLSYLLDVYRKEIDAEVSVLKLGTYICMFPQLVAGPIVSYSEVKNNLDHPSVSLKLFDEGLKDFTIGLAMKVLLADRLSLFWNDLAGIGYESVATPLLWLGSVSYSLQIYFDFFGYSMMAIGLGKLLGFSLPKNFDLPYMATSIRDFYRRWHMTLGRWFSKYIYIPLGGSRNGLGKTLRNLLIVWILTALWHGVSVNFVLWGMLLCAVIMIEKVMGMRMATKKVNIVTQACLDDNSSDKNEDEDVCNDTELLSDDVATVDADSEDADKVESTNGSVCENGNDCKKLKLKLTICNVLQHIYVLLIIVLSWTCFAITDLGQLQVYLGRMFGVVAGINVSGSVIGVMLHKYGLTILIGILLCTKPAHVLYQKLRDSWIGMIALAILFWLAVWYVHMMGNNPFLYFRF